jgi:hypothetical protein
LVPFVCHGATQLRFTPTTVVAIDRSPDMDLQQDLLISSISESVVVAGFSIDGDEESVHPADAATGLPPLRTGRPVC